MASKKTLMVNFVRSGRRRWSLSLEGTDSDVLREVSEAVRESCEKYGVAVVNAAKPFGETEAVEKKKKARKPKSDKGARRAEHPANDGQAIEGRVSSPSVRA